MQTFKILKAQIWSRSTISPGKTCRPPVVWFQPINIWCVKKIFGPLGWWSWPFDLISGPLLFDVEWWVDRLVLAKVLKTSLSAVQILLVQHLKLQRYDSIVLNQKKWWAKEAPKIPAKLLAQRRWRGKISSCNPSSMRSWMISRTKFLGDFGHETCWSTWQNSNSRKESSTAWCNDMFVPWNSMEMPLTWMKSLESWFALKLQSLH